MERTLARPYGGYATLAWLQDYSREWAVASKNPGFYHFENSEKLFSLRKIWLNIKPHIGKRVNGIVIVIKQNDLGGFDLREKGYNRIQVQDRLRGFSDELEVAGGPIYTYIPKTDCQIVPSLESKTCEISVSLSYLEIVENSLKLISSEFEKQFHASTSEVPEHLLVADHMEDTNSRAIQATFDKITRMNRLHQGFFTSPGCHPV